MGAKNLGSKKLYSVIVTVVITRIYFSLPRLSRLGRGVAFLHSEDPPRFKTMANNVLRAWLDSSPGRTFLKTKCGIWLSQRWWRVVCSSCHVSVSATMAAQLQMATKPLTLGKEYQQSEEDSQSYKTVPSSPKIWLHGQHWDATKMDPLAHLSVVSVGPKEYESKGKTALLVSILRTDKKNPKPASMTTSSS
jgi:hypothetical protein